MATQHDDLPYWRLYPWMRPLSGPRRIGHPTNPTAMVFAADPATTRGQPRAEWFDVFQNALPEYQPPLEPDWGAVKRLLIVKPHNLRSGELERLSVDDVVALLRDQQSRPSSDRDVLVPAAWAEDRPLPPSRVHAHESYVRALEHNPELKGQPLRKVYDWLKEHDPDPDYKLPRFVSWTRCLRAYRQDQRGAFTSPRASRPHGPSVVHHDQL